MPADVGVASAVDRDSPAEREAGTASTSCPDQRTARIVFGDENLLVLTGRERGLVGLAGAGNQTEALFDDLVQFGSGSQKGLRAIERLAGGTNREPHEPHRAETVG